jgi:probable HAF family extracellular repeat protein
MWEVIFGNIEKRVVICAVLCGALAGNASAASTVAVDLGTLGGPFSAAVALNADGQVVGWSHTGDFQQHAFSWTREGGMVDLGTLGGTSSFAAGVSVHGQVVGASTICDDSTSHAFSWTRSGGMIDLGTLGGAWSYAYGVSSRGQVVGVSLTTGDLERHAFSWTEEDGIVDLGSLGGTESAPAGYGGGLPASPVNARGQVVGASRNTGDATWNAFSWTQSGGMVDLGTLGGTFSEGMAVNAYNQVVGSATTTGNRAQHAFSWTRLGGMVDLGSLGGASQAFAVSDQGHVIGASGTANGDVHAFWWTKTSGMVDLGTVGGTASVAFAVNAHGQAAGHSYTAGNIAQHAVLWQVVTASANEAN